MDLFKKAGPMFLAGSISDEGEGSIALGEVLENGKIYVSEIVDVIPREHATRRSSKRKKITFASAPPRTR